MSAQADDDGLVDVFVKGAVLALGAAAAGLVLRRVFGREPEVIVVAVAADELRGGGGRARGRGAEEAEPAADDGVDELEVELDEDELDEEDA